MDADQPLVTFVMPCYNSAAFMERGVGSLLAATAGYPCEILLVNDGSADDTGAIAHRFAQAHPHVTAIDQENANWGGVVNRGIALARGRYFKVIDSDDRFDPQAVQQVLATLQRLCEAGTAPDLLVTNYVYDRISDNTSHVMHYRKLFPRGRVFTWSDMGRPGTGQFIMVHASWYATAVLRESGLELPCGVSYMDSLVVLHPMPYVRTLYYLDVDAYYYLIGREGQSVEVDVVKRHIDEQLLASRLAIEDVDYDELYRRNPNCARLMMGYVMCMMSVSTIYLFMLDTPDSLAKNAQLWGYLRETSPTLYRYVHRSWAGLANRRTWAARKGACLTYKLVQKVFKFA